MHLVVALCSVKHQISGHTNVTPSHHVTSPHYHVTSSRYLTPRDNLRHRYMCMVRLTVTVGTGSVIRLHPDVVRVAVTLDSGLEIHHG